MSSIVAFRERIMEEIRTRITDLYEVNWYDGIFDENDLVDWSHKTPAAYVSVLVNTDTQHHATGELNVPLRCVVVVLDSDTHEPRNADERIWKICEDIGVLANRNTFGDPHAGNATKIKFQRLVHPELRREGVAVGLVEWQSILTLGINQVERRDFVWHDGRKVTQHPRARILGYADVELGPISGRDTVDLTPEEGT